MYFSLAVAALVGSASGAILWDGRFNDLTSSTDLNYWSWSNQTGPYQYYIHGSGPVTNYVNFSPSYKNPADSGSTKGAKITLDSTAYWNGQTMRRTELIPQTTAPINSGKVYYHFSLMRSGTNPPSLYREHQIAFFESHFTELKAGANSGQTGPDATLRWAVSSQTKWSTTWDADVWHNVAYEIDFSANTVAFWHSTGADPLTLTVPAVSVSTSSNGADWHVGVLELPTSGQSDTNEDYYWSGVYIESGSLTTSVAGPGGVVNPPSSTTTTQTSTIRTSTTSVRTSTTTTLTTSVRTSTTLTTSVRTSTTTTTTARISTTTTRTTTPVQTTTTTTAGGGGGGTLPKWSQCGGLYWTGSGTCVAGTTCVYSNDWYSQCL